MTAVVACSTCAHANRAHRGYCGRCGGALHPVCRGCRFVNERGDRYCGGCGSPLAEVVFASAPAPIVEKPTKHVSNELTDLFAPTAATEPAEALPAAGITQDDLDRLFGVAP